MNWFGGSTSDAVRCVREQRKKLLVFFRGNDAASMEMDANFDAEFDTMCNHFVCLRLVAPSEAAAQFSAVYTVERVPCVYLIAPTGKAIEVKLGATNKNDLLAWLSKHIDGPVNSASEAEQQLPVGAEASSSATLAPSVKIPSSSTLLKEQTQPSSRVVEERHREGPLDKRAKVSDKETREHQRSREVEELMLERRKDEAEKRRLRECLRQQIEDDRRARLERAGFSNLPDSSLQTTNCRPTTSASCTSFPSVGTDGTRLQLRFINGGHIVGCFPNAATLAGEVRNWLQDLAQNSNDENIAPSFVNDSVRKNLLSLVTHGYRFRQLHPARLFDPEDETRSVADLGLSPSAVLVLVPTTRHYTSSVQQTTGGVVSRLYSFVSTSFHDIYAYAAWVFNSFWYLGSSFFATTGPNSIGASPQSPTQIPPSDSKPSTVSKSGLPLEARSIRRQGNMARLSHMPDNSDDEQARWNGNSTAQL